MIRRIAAFLTGWTRSWADAAEQPSPESEGYMVGFADGLILATRSHR